MANHFFWDDASAIALSTVGAVGVGPFTVLAVIIGVTIVLLVGLDAAGSERSWAAAILEPEVAAGTLEQAEADAIAGTHRHRRTFVKSVHGHHARRTAKHVLTAGEELATEIGRAGGAETAAVQHARAEVTRLRAA